MSIFWIAQGIGVIALVFSILSYQSKTRDQILLRQLLGSIVYIVHFTLLSAWTGVVMNAIVVFRNWIFRKKDTESWASTKIGRAHV